MLKRPNIFDCTFDWLVFILFKRIQRELITAARHIFNSLDYAAIPTKITTRAKHYLTPLFRRFTYEQFNDQPEINRCLRILEKYPS